jgi:O-Antigen ligase
MQSTSIVFGQRQRRFETAGAGPRVRGEASLLAAGLAALIILLAYFMASPEVLWCSLVPALWLAASHPARLVQLLAVTSPVFPVIRLTADIVGAQQVSTKGMFLSGDDPIITALGVAWLLSRSRLQGTPSRSWYPSALVWLLVVYPLVSLANLGRLDTNQSTVSLLYYLKWAEYVILVVIVPQIVRGTEAIGLAESFPRIMMAVLLLSSVFAVYEVAESFRTGTYSQAATIPRASSFFGTLDPKRFGASEDPVNFGTYVIVAGSVALAMMGSRKRLGWLPGISFLASLVALVLSASRAPWLAAVPAYGRVQKIGSSRLLLGALVVAGAVTGTLAFAPQLWHASFSRFEALADWNQAAERSATSRLEIARNSPVFDIDQYWLIGHGHSSYRFVAEEHLSRITTGVSRSLYNFLLTTWYDGGPVVLTLWILLFIQLRRRLNAVQVSSPSRAARTFASGLSGALWGIALAAMFGEVPYNWRVMGVFYLATGVCLAADEAARAAASSHPAGLVFQRWVYRP